MSDQPSDPLPPDQRALRDRALRNLLRAAQEAGGELSYPWVAKGDPDFNVFRDERKPDQRWNALMDRLAPPERKGETREAAPEPVVPRSQRIADEAASARGRRAVAESAPRRMALPESPLGTGVWRRIGWTAAAIAVLVIAVVAVVAAAGALVAQIVLALVLAVPAIALALRARTAWIERRPVTAQATRSDPSRRRGFRRRRGSS
jgi:hypothetical protein